MSPVDSIEWFIPHCIGKRNRNQEKDYFEKNDKRNKENTFHRAGLRLNGAVPRLSSLSRVERRFGGRGIVLLLFCPDSLSRD